MLKYYNFTITIIIIIIYFVPLAYSIALHTFTIYIIYMISVLILYFVCLFYYPFSNYTLYITLVPIRALQECIRFFFFLIL